MGKTQRHLIPVGGTETMPNWPPSSWNGGRDQIVIGGCLRWNPQSRKEMLLCRIGSFVLAVALALPIEERLQCLTLRCIAAAA